MFDIGDIVESKMHVYKGVVIGYNPKLQRMVKVKRDDGIEGNNGPFWQTHENHLELISRASLINE